MSDQMTLKGKVAVIAGAAGGLGSVVAKSLAEQGVKLVLLGRDRTRLENLLEDLSLPTDHHLIQAVDLIDPKALSDIAQRAHQELGEINFLLNLVGGWTGGETLTEVPAETIHNMLDQHLWTTYHLVQAFVPYLESSTTSRVVVVSSPTATQPGAKSGPYAIGKAAQEALMMTLAKEIKRPNVTANVIQVKAIDTGHRRESDPSGKYAKWTTPEEITEAILYLCSDQSQMINGARIPLYG